MSMATENWIVYGKSRKFGPMSILVTGGAGYIGSHMVNELADAGERVLVLDNLSTGFDWAVPATVPLIVGDTGDEARVRAVLSEHAVDTIIHFAASIVLRDAGAAHGLRYVILRYFNVAGADPSGRAGQSTKGATHLIKVAVEAALGRRPKIQVYGMDYPTPDGTCIRDYIHVSDLVA